MLYSVFINSQNIFCNMALSKTATMSRQHKRLLVPEKNVLSRNWSLLVCPAFLTRDISWCRYDCQASWHSCFKLSALTYSVNRLFCCCLASSLSAFCVRMGFYSSAHFSFSSFFFCWAFCTYALISLGPVLLLFLLLVLNNSSKGSGKFSPSLSGIHCPCSQWLGHNIWAFTL